VPIEPDASPDALKDRLIRRRVMLGTASNLVGQIAVFLISFLLTPFLLRRLGPSLYGLWVLTGSIVAYGSVLDFGIWGTIIRYVAQYHAQGDDTQIRRLLRTVFLYYLGICLLIAAAGIVLAPFVPRLFQLPPEQHQLARRLIMLMSLSIGLTLPGTVPLSVLRGLQRYDLVNLIDITMGVLTAVAIVAVLLLGGGVIGLALVNLGGILITFGLGQIALLRVAPGLVLTRRIPDTAAYPLYDAPMFRLTFGYSWPLFVQAIASRLQSRTDEITIGLFLPVNQVGAYSVARRLSETTQILTRQFMKTLLPLASQLDAEQDYGRLRSVFLLGTRLTLALVSMLSGLLIALAGPILAVWVGAEYAVYASVVTVLALAYVFITLRASAVVILQAVARHRILAASSLAAGMANLALSLLLIRPLGLVGVALGTLIPAMLESCCVVLPYAMRVAHAQPREVWSEVLVPALLPVAPMLAVFYTLRAVLVPSSLPMILLVAAAGLFVYAVTYLSLARGVERRWLGDIRFYLRRVRGMLVNWS
jgi:O-antigen/teichoic acid export membrane protein